MGLMAVIGGTLVMLTAAAFYAMPTVRHMEATLPDYKPQTADEEPGAEMRGPAEPATA